MESDLPAVRYLVFPLEPVRGSSPIMAHIVCFHEQIETCMYAVDVKSRQHIQDKKSVGGIRI